MKPEALVDLEFFDGLSLADLELLAPSFAPVSYLAGSTVFSQGGLADFVYLVVEGEVVIHYKPEDGPLMDVTRVSPGGVFGWSAAMSNPFYTSGAVCILDTKVVRIHGSDLRELCEKHPSVGKIILERLASVIAERKRSCHPAIASMLENNLRQASQSQGDD